MTTIKLKTEIQKVIDEVPEPLLEEILEYLKFVQLISKNNPNKVESIRVLLRGNNELLPLL